MPEIAALGFLRCLDTTSYTSEAVDSWQKPRTVGQRLGKAKGMQKCKCIEEFSRTTAQQKTSESWVELID